MKSKFVKDGDLYKYYGPSGKVVTLCEEGIKRLEAETFSIMGIDARGYLNILHTVLIEGYGYHRKTRIHTLLTKCPKGMCVDHINGDPSDNRLVNLRIGSTQANLRNQSTTTSSKTNERHIYYYRHALRVCVFGKHVGYFKNMEDARTSRDAYYKIISYSPDR